MCECLPLRLWLRSMFGSPPKRDADWLRGYLDAMAIGKVHETQSWCTEHLTSDFQRFAMGNMQDRAAFASALKKFRSDYEIEHDQVPFLLQDGDCLSARCYTNIVINGKPMRLETMLSFIFEQERASVLFELFRTVDPGLAGERLFYWNHPQRDFDASHRGKTPEWNADSFADWMTSAFGGELDDLDEWVEKWIDGDFVLEGESHRTRRGYRDFLAVFRKHRSPVKCGSTDWLIQQGSRVSTRFYMTCEFWPFEKGNGKCVRDEQVWEMIFNPKTGRLSSAFALTRQLDADEPYWEPWRRRHGGISI